MFSQLEKINKMDRVELDKIGKALENCTQENLEVVYQKEIQPAAARMCRNHRTLNLPAYWQAWVNNHPQLSKGECAKAFDGGVVRLKWEDGSTVDFKYAFCVVSREREEVCVFTEHCGYHVYSTLGLEII